MNELKELLADVFNAFIGIWAKWGVAIVLTMLASLWTWSFYAGLVSPHFDDYVVILIVSLIILLSAMYLIGVNKK